MKSRSTWKWLLATLASILPIAFLTMLVVGPSEVARGKSASRPLMDELDREQQLAQELALQDARVQAYTAGHRSEVFGVVRTGKQYTQASRACAASQCLQVNLYNLDENTSVIAIVDTKSEKVLDVIRQHGMRPGINARLAERAREIAFNAPELIEVLGYQPTTSDWAPMDADLSGTACDEGHFCVAPTFDLGKYILWAFVDLTTEEFIDLAWTAQAPDDGSTSIHYEPEGCPAPGTLNRSGWSLSYETTPSDGLRVYQVSYQGQSALSNAKLVEWHVDYGSNGFRDSTGCGGGSGGGFPIYPYGETQVLDMMDEGIVAGFEVVQDFRQSNWGADCNYRYEQRYQFFNDGRFRIVAGAHGKGCDTNSLYRPLILIDVAVGEDSDERFAAWDGSEWLLQETEIRLDPENPISPEGYGWMVTDSSGAGYYIEPGRGQFGDGGWGDNEFVYAVKHQPTFDIDMGVIGNCCDEDNHGPE
ncbi:MAG: hypothetical protein M3220_06365, partial [Chloroflexota bacterium]|nr:hypothetical protein [Chloroflexota bacterium]